MQSQASKARLDGEILLCAPNFASRRHSLESGSSAHGGAEAALEAALEEAEAQLVQARSMAVADVESELVRHTPAAVAGIQHERVRGQRFDLVSLLAAAGRRARAPRRCEALSGIGRARQRQPRRRACEGTCRTAVAQLEQLAIGD